MKKKTIIQREWLTLFKKTVIHFYTVTVFPVRSNFKTFFCSEVEGLGIWNSTSVTANVTDFKLTKPEHKDEDKN